MICTIWGLHFPVMRTAISGAGIPPLFYAATRMSIVAVIMSPFLKWHSGQMRFVAVAGLGFGALNYALMFPAMGLTTASAGAVAIELYMPFSILLGVLILGERIKAWSMLGIVLAFAGVVIIGLSKPGGDMGPYFALGVIMIAGAALSEACGAIAVKTLKEISPAQLVAWFAVIGSVILWPLTGWLEQDQLKVFAPQTRSGFFGALFYSAILTSIVAHGSYYWLLGRLPIQVIAPIGLMTTVIGVISGILILGETPTVSLFIGMTITLSGIAIILWRRRVNTPQPRKIPPVEPYAANADVQ